MKVKRIAKKLKKQVEEKTAEICISDLKSISLRLDFHEIFPDWEPSEVGTVTLDIRSRDSMLKKTYKFIMPRECLEESAEIPENECEEPTEFYIRITRGESITIDCCGSVEALQASRGTDINRLGELDLTEIVAKQFSNRRVEEAELW